MLVYAITVVVLLAIIAITSVGVMMGRKPITGSCGGVGAALGETDYVCDICGGDPNKCENQSNDDGEVKADRLAYDATAH